MSLPFAFSLGRRSRNHQTVSLESTRTDWTGLSGCNLRMRRIGLWWVHVETSLTLTDSGLYQALRPVATRCRDHGADPSDPPTWSCYRRTTFPTCSLIGVSAKVGAQHGAYSPLLRDHSLWFIDTSVIDSLDLRKWMGFVQETIVAKHAARMGLVSRSFFGKADPLSLSAPVES